jgi:hypothetical protein
MKIYIIGNELVEEDRLPLLMMEALQKEFPQCSFEEADPNENFIPEEGSVIIDTVEGIHSVTWFHTLDAFVQTQSVSPHDYDLGFHLLFLTKVHKISDVSILGIPKSDAFEKILQDVIRKLRTVTA